VESVRADQVTLCYSGVVMENEEGTIPLSAPRTRRCLLSIGQCVRLATPTMDGGRVIAVTLDRVE
jgi:hypothetical protein